MFVDPIERARLQQLYKAAGSTLSETADRSNQVLSDSAKATKEFFEKIALGAGASIAAIVSFLGAQNVHLHPRWLLRSALVSLFVTAFFAMYRLLRMPYYHLAASNRQYFEAKKQHEEQKWSSYEYDSRSGVQITDVHTGHPFDLAAAKATMSHNVETLDDVIKQQKRREGWLWFEVKWAGRMSIISGGAALLSLTTLAWVNF
jgi:hypothetical protein